MRPTRSATNERTPRLSRRARPALGLAALLFLVPALASCSRRVDLEPLGNAGPEIRVLLLDKQERVKIAVFGPYEVWLSGGGEQPRKLFSGEDMGEKEARYRDLDVIIDGVVCTRQTVEIIPQRVPVEVGGRRYRGSLRISGRNGGLRVINVLSMEGYLRGVVPGEMKSRWPAAALEAQAIAARSYALTRMERRADGQFDVFATPADQNYLGLDRETERTNAAVAATSGAVLRYGGQVLPAYYHACCGGSTAKARQVFGDTKKPLQGVRCTYCTRADLFKWEKTIPLNEAARKLSVNDLIGLSLQVPGLDGRVAEVTLHRADGSTLQMVGSTFRSRLGLLSTRFKLKAAGSDFVFEGGGYGHGVGLCQWGAKGMADIGRSREQILEHYYPGARIVKSY